MDTNILEVKHLKTFFYTDRAVVKAVDDVNLSVQKGKTLCIVGESGCGKSVTAMSIMRLVQKPGKSIGGEILYGGKDLLQISDREIRDIRGKDISMIFQEPMTSLNPVFKIGDQIMEVLALHKGLNKKEARNRAKELLGLVRIPRADKIIDEYPHQLSGGMRQRVMIAMALACEPKILIADEPTTALDVTIQAQILELMNNIKTDLQTSIILITHDLGVVAEMADFVTVMYAGKVVEESDVLGLYAHPSHPYTVGLLNSRPSLEETRVKLECIEGNVPNPGKLPTGCYFHPRCKYATEQCEKEMPEIKEIYKGHSVRCFYPLGRE